MKKTLLFAILAFSMNAFAQTPDWLWAKAMNGTDSETAVSTLVLSGNVYTSGYFYGTVDFDPGEGIFNLTSAGSSDIFVTKTDASGNLVWARRMGGKGEEVLFAASIDGLGNAYTTGYFKGTADFDPGPGIFNLTTYSTKSEAFISKLDKDGNFVWAKRIGGASNDAIAEGYSIALDTAGNMFITGGFIGTVDFDPGSGVFDISSVGLDIYISKFNAEGNFVWAKTIGGGVNNYSNALAIDIPGNVYTACHFDGTVDFDPGSGIFNLTAPAGKYSGVISKLDSSGNFVWAKQMDKIEINSLAIDASDNIYSTGCYSDTVDFDPGAGILNLVSAGYLDIFISKLNSSGDFVFAKGMGGTGWENVRCITIDNEENIYTIGDFQETADFDPGTGSFNLSSIGGSDIFVSKLDKLGNFIWAKAAGGTGNDRGNSIALDSLCNIYLSGDFRSPSISFDTIALINADNSGSYDAFIAKTGDKTTGIEKEVKRDDNFSVFPNPTNGRFTINSNSTISSVEIYNLPGARIYSDIKPSQQTSCEIDISGQPKGIYLVKVNSGIGNNIRKIVLQYSVKHL